MWKSGKLPKVKILKKGNVENLKISKFKYTLNVNYFIIVPQNKVNMYE